jgi:hypothetical protein
MKSFAQHDKKIVEDMAINALKILATFRLNRQNLG